MKLFLSSKETNDSDSVLLERFMDSDNLEILGELYTRHTEMIYYVCLRYFKDEEQSKDGVMQIFEELTSKIRKHDVKDFSKWIYVVAKNFCLMRLRSSKNNIEIPLDNFVEFSTTLHQVDDYSEKESKFMQLENCVDKLPDKQKITVDLFFLKEKCYKDITEITGYTLNEVKSFIQNGKRNLKNCMEKTND